MYEFDADYLEDAAQAVVHYLRRNVACELSYWPGNGTLYDLIVVPAANLAKAASWMDHQKARSITADRPELADEEHWILLAWIGHGCWQVDLRSVWSAAYFAEKFGACTVGDGEALRALLLEVSDKTGLRRLQAAS